MPLIVPSLSWGFVRMRYTTFAKEHVMKFHISELDPSTGAWATPRTGTYAEVYLLDTLDNFISIHPSKFPTSTVFNTAEVFENQPGAAPATLVATFTVGTPTIAPSGQPHAACFSEWIFGSTVGEKVRYTFKDTWLNEPQRFGQAELVAPATTWINYMLGGGLIVTRNGYALQFFQSVTSNVNREDFHKYGRFVQP